MKAALLMVIFTAFAESPSRAQTFNLNTNNSIWTTNAAVRETGSEVSFQTPAAFGLGLGEPRDTNSVDYISGHTKVHLSGPVATTLKPKSPADFGHRVLRLFSPVSSLPQNLPPGAEVSGPAQARAWSTLVGWSPGRTGFPDEQHHEPPVLRLISVSVENQP